MASKILAFSAKRYCGKTTIAKRIENFSVFRRYSFAAVLREMYAARIGVPLSDIYDCKELHRPGLIRYSWECKEQSRYYFADALMEIIRVSEDEYIVVDDLRFSEELARLREANAVVYRVTATHETRRNRGWQFHPDIDQEFSETDLDSIPTSVWEQMGGVVQNNHLSEYNLDPTCIEIIGKHFPGAFLPEFAIFRQT